MDFRHVGQRLFWAALSRTAEMRSVGELRLYDARVRRDGRPAGLLDGAWWYLGRAGEEFRAAVTAHVPNVVASGYSNRMFPAVGAYFTTYRGREATSPLNHASRLVWAAEYVRRWNLPGFVDDAALRRACDARRLAFLDAVGEAPDWIGSLRRVEDVRDDG